MSPFRIFLGVLQGLQASMVDLHQWLQELPIEVPSDEAGDVRQLAMVKLLSDGSSIYRSLVEDNVAGLADVRPENAADIVKDAVLPELDRRFKAYVKRMCRFRFLDLARREGRRPDPLSSDGFPDAADPGHDLDGEIDVARFEVVHGQFLAALSQQDREQTLVLVALAEKTLSMQDLIATEARETEGPGPHDRATRIRVRDRLYGRHSQVRGRLNRQVDAWQSNGRIDDEMADMLRRWLLRLSRRRIQGG